MSGADHIKNQTILLADDDENILSLLNVVLSQHGYNVILAVDGQDAVEKFMLAPEQIDLVVSDITMPRKDGISSVNEMKIVDPDLKIILITGYSHEPTPPGITIVQKPFSHQQIIHTIRTALSPNC